MDLGWCDVCLRVKSARDSREFYADLGFWRVEGCDEEGWSVITNGDLRLGLFESSFMSDAVTLNFRGGDVEAIARELIARGHSLEGAPREGPNGGGTAVLRDPNGYMISFDTAPGETRRDDPIP